MTPSCCFFTAIVNDMATKTQRCFLSKGYCYISDCAQHKENMYKPFSFYLSWDLWFVLFFCEASLVLIFILATARCVILIMICATEKSEMVMSWITSNADAIYGLYFNFLYSVNIIYFDIV